MNAARSAKVVDYLNVRAAFSFPHCSYLRACAERRQRADREGKESQRSQRRFDTSLATLPVDPASAGGFAAGQHTPCPLSRPDTTISIPSASAWLRGKPTRVPATIQANIARRAGPSLAKNP